MSYSNKNYIPLLIFFVVLWISWGFILYFSRGTNVAVIGTNGLAVLSFICDLVSVAGVVGCFGLALTGRFTGIAINGQNQYSLSRAQMAFWTIVVVAALASYVRVNLTGFFGIDPDPLKIMIPGDLLAAMGIAAFTTAATPAVLALKASQAPDGDNAEAAAKSRVADMTGGSADDVATQGKVIIRTQSKYATWLDLVSGDEVANAGTIDISKVQQLLITVLLIGSYIFSVMNALAVGGCDPADDLKRCSLTTLPLLSPNFIALLALSHAGYLAYKITPKAPSGPGDDTDAAAGAGNVAVAAASALTIGTDQTPVRVPDDTTTVRLAIEDFATLSSFSLLVDDKPQAVDERGFVELSLSKGDAHNLSAAGLRNGTKVQGTLTIVPDVGDHLLLRSLDLA